MIKLPERSKRDKARGEKNKKFPLNFWRKFKKKLRFADEEIRQARKIIKSPPLQTDKYTDLMRECDQVFIKRLKQNPGALKMSFWENHFEHQKVLKYPEIDGKILDFGCGSGQSDIMLARKGKTIHGVDASPIGVSLANFHRERQPRKIQKRLKFFCINITKSDKPSEKYDSVWSSHVFEHISDPAPIFLSLKHWVKPGAFMLLSVPFGKAYYDPSHINFFYNYNKEEATSFFKKFIKVKKVEVDRRYKVIRVLCQF